MAQGDAETLSLHKRECCCGLRDDAAAMASTGTRGGRRTNRSLRSDRQTITQL
eukprot:CAMPEP_0119351636 /NCGR_PEP_ID=MMETSP1334-20130426/939_1 /TAXON_ID=127549 /ORGANISM="Calcidiscus leptoporus, Strain RCC1130" /LENGTH=52 /DNA_ID=CAMNT_0007364483 /DNA_START=124 /DNA_END=279 /DNA_ORIENTATION=+